MSADRPKTASEMIAWLRAHPEEPYYTVAGGTWLVVGTRNDDGELNAWLCSVRDHGYRLDPPPACQPKTTPPRRPQ